MGDVCRPCRGDPDTRLFEEERKIRRPHHGTAVQDDGPRRNTDIRISPVRVVDQDGNMLGEMPTDEARRLAFEADMDLVEVSPNARPPVCRIMDYGKLKYEKQRKSSSNKGHRTKLKEIRLRAKTGQHDIDFKVNQAKQFLERHDKVKVSVRFRGRENAHHDRGREMLEEISQSLAEVANLETPPKMEGPRMMSMMLAPKG